MGVISLEISYTDYLAHASLHPLLNPLEKETTNARILKYIKHGFPYANAIHYIKYMK